MAMSPDQLRRLLKEKEKEVSVSQRLDEPIAPDSGLGKDLVLEILA